MDRAASINSIEDTDLWDIVVIGGGATGLGVAADAALRGYKTLLVEQADFTKGTSSRSTKLVHGGVRYLAQKDIKLVLEALHERGLLLQNAPHLCSNQSFIIPNYSDWKGIYYTIGLKIYDLLAGRLSLGKSEYLNARKVVSSLPSIKKDGLKNGVVYHDGQFDDSRLGINLAQTCSNLGGTVINYFKVFGLLRDDNGLINGINGTDLESGKSYRINARVVVNATGVFTDQILAMDRPGAAATIKPSQGTHIVLDKTFFPGDYAMMIPETDDGRVLFAIPWHDKVVVGTTDVVIEKAELEPEARQDEIDFILETFGKYVEKKPERKDILSVFAGLRPLAMPSKGGGKTKEISRSHKLFVTDSNLVTITGGKWTTYRKMAEETVDIAATVGNLKKIPCKTEHFPVHGAGKITESGWLGFYGTDAEQIRKIIKNEEGAGNLLHPQYSFTIAEVKWAARAEMARSVDDILARRLRLLFLDARAAISVAPQVAEILGKELNKGSDWVQHQIADFKNIARNYLPR